MNHRYDFVYLFDCTDANPNGDPDAGNLPRVDSDTGHGLTTDVMLKRKIRNYISMTKPQESPYGIYVSEGAVLGRAHTEAFKKLGINIGEDSKIEISEESVEEFNEMGLADGLRIETDEDEKSWLILEGIADKKLVKDWLKESELSRTHQKLINDLLKNAKSRKPTREETAYGRDQMCKDYFDIRTFGAVMSIKSAPNCGQVRGPIQLSFSRSIDPIQQSEHSITRMAVTKEEDFAKERTMGRKFTVPYALYQTHGFVNPFLAVQTGFSEEDLELFFVALEQAFQFDQSAARPAGSMAPRGLLVFKHDNQLGHAASHTLFDRLKFESFEKTPAEDGKPPRHFSDYGNRITFDGQPLDDFIKPGETKDLGNGITLIRRI
jgi:CRISPR-associated protein Csd2